MIIISSMRWAFMVINNKPLLLVKFSENMKPRKVEKAGLLNVFVKGGLEMQKPGKLRLINMVERRLFIVFARKRSWQKR